MHRVKAKGFQVRLVSVLLSIFGIVTWAIANDSNVECQLHDPQVLLPDGTPFLTWNDSTRYVRTYYVSQNNPLASDTNDGTENHPFLTINHAAQIVLPGERVCIHAGIYRELVRPRFSGAGPDRMIAYMSAPHEKVIIRGSRVISGKWELSVDPNDALNVANDRNESGAMGFPANIYSKQLWMTTLPDSMFGEGYFAFRTPNASRKELDLMNWASRWKGRIPYTLPRGLIFQNGRRMTQLSTYEDLVHLPGSYWVGCDGKTIHIHPFDGVNPNGQFFEAAVQQHIFQPLTQGLGYIRVTGLILEQCANGFLRSGVGALFTMGGHHWIIDGNTVRHVNSVGIEIGNQAYERGDAHFVRRTNAASMDVGHNIVRGNCVSDCGTAGIRGLGSLEALVENNELVDCGWQDVEFHWEVAGIKLLGSRDSLVQNNHVARVLGGCGIWLDWDNRNSRITRNIINDITTVQGAIFIEASQKTNLVDDNVLWNINGEGVRLADTDNAIVAHNLFGNVSEELVVAKVVTDRSIGGRNLTSTHNQIVNNIAVDQGKPILTEDPSNFANYNVYVSTKAGQTALKDAGEQSVAIHANIAFDKDSLSIAWKSESPLPVAPVLKSAGFDFFMHERMESNNIPGPFLRLTHSMTLQLSDGLRVACRWPCP